MIIYQFKKGSEQYVNIKTAYGVTVESSEGLEGKPALKSVDSFEWKYLHGSIPDLRNRRYENKEIKLNCWISASSKQMLVESLNNFLGFFSYDELLWMKVSWDNNDGHGTIVPDPHASKGIFSLVYLKSVSSIEYKYRFGNQMAKFTLTLIDPYPMKRVVKYSGTGGDGVDYDIISDTEIDIYIEDGMSVIDILNGNGHLDCAINSIILICGDVVHASTNNVSGKLIEPTNDSEDNVNTIYNEI